MCLSSSVLPLSLLSLCDVHTVRLTQKWIEGEYWAQQFATRSLIAFTHVKDGPTAARNAMSDALKKKGVAFKTAKHGALRHGLEDTPWKQAACAPAAAAAAAARARLPLLRRYT